MKGTPDFKPALRYKFLTGIYDSVVSSTMPEQRFKKTLLEQATILKGHKVLDFGVGSATLSLMAAQMQSGAEFTGMDVDKEILEIAAEKIKQQQAAINLVQYDGSILPFQDNHFDRVISSLVFHHLLPEQKQRAIYQILRVLKTGGELHIADWGKPADVFQRVLYYSIQVFDGFDTTSDNAQGLLPQYILDAKFKSVEITGSFRTIYGTLTLIKAIK